MPAHPSPESADRIITCGLSLNQNVGMGAQINMWFPRQAIEPAQLSAIDSLQWLAIRQIEILREGNHYELFELDMDNFKRSLRWFNASRAHGQRFIVIIGGSYRSIRNNQDHLVRFDHRFRNRLRSLVNMIWLDEMNAVTRRHSGMADKTGDWDIATLLPQIGALFGAHKIFQRDVLQTIQSPHYDLAMRFLAATRRLPCAAAKEHSVFVGLKIPQHQADNDVDWAPSSEGSRLNFAYALQSVFNTFGMDTPTAHHPRAHGDHMNYKRRDHYASMPIGYKTEFDYAR